MADVAYARQNVLQEAGDQASFLSCAPNVGILQAHSVLRCMSRAGPPCMEPESVHHSLVSNAYGLTKAVLAMHCQLPVMCTQHGWLSLLVAFAMRSAGAYCASPITLWASA